MLAQQFPPAQPPPSFLPSPEEVTGRKGWKEGKGKKGGRGKRERSLASAVTGSEDQSSR